MAFYLYEKAGENEFRKTREIKLAGRNSIYNLWCQKKPLDKGWEITQKELLKHITKKHDGYENFKIIIDFYPSSDNQIELIEIFDMFIYTYGNEQGEVSWSVLMVRVRDFWKCYNIDTSNRNKHLELITCEEHYEDDIFEFLYLQGEDGGWKWGKVGMVNAAFIHKKAREYFKRWFCL